MYYYITTADKCGAVVKNSFGGYHVEAFPFDDASTEIELFSSYEDAKNFLELNKKHLQFCVNDDEENFFIEKIETFDEIYDKHSSATITYKDYDNDDNE